MPRAPLVSARSLRDAVLDDIGGALAFIQDERDLQRTFVKRLALLAHRIAALSADSEESAEVYELILADMQDRARKSKAAEREMVDWVRSYLDANLSEPYKRAWIQELRKRSVQ